MDDLPFVCPFCGERFGLGPGAPLLCIVSAVPINGEPTPCCGTPFYGSIEKEPLRLVRTSGERVTA